MVTGAARGLGRAAAVGLAAHGADVALIDLDRQRCADTVGEIMALLVRLLNPRLQSLYHLIGLCHDLGEILLRQHFMAEYDGILQFSLTHGLNVRQVEAVAIGIAVFLSDGCPLTLRTPLVFLTELLAAIQEAMAKSQAQRRASTEHEQAAKRLASLTDRERQVLEQIVAGRLNKQIAAELGTVEKTIKFHRGNLMRKMGVRVVADLVRLAERAGVGSTART